MKVKTPGYLVETASGPGRTYYRDGLINGKCIVHLLDTEGRPIMDEKGNPKKLLVSRENIKLIGFID